MLDNNDKVLQLVEYDGKLVSVTVIWGGVISDPQDRQRSTTRGVADINWEVEPAPGNSHTASLVSSDLYRFSYLC